MDAILNTFFGMIEDLTDDAATAQLVFAILLGLAVFTLMVAAILLGTSVINPLRRRLRRLNPEAPPVNQGGTLARMFEPVSQLATPRAAEARSRSEHRLRQAGIAGPGAIGTFYGVKLLLVVLLPGAVAGTLATLTDLSGPSLAILAGVAGIAGYSAPGVWLDRAIKSRSAEIRHGLPDALDLLVVCSEAGLGLASSIQRVAADLDVSHPTLAAELRVFGFQTRAGMSNHEALRDLEERNGVDDLRGLVTTLLQSMRFGTSVATTLRIYSEELRDRRTQRAEEHAAKVGTKMLFPLVLCIFPAFFVVALGPPLLGAVAALNAGG